MAVAKKSVTSTTRVNTWEEDLAKQAESYAEQEASAFSGGQFFSTRSGILSFDGTTMPNNEIAVIILDGVMENVLYEDAFDPDNPTSPTCFAFGRNEKEMTPHEAVTVPQCETCAACPKNQWGTSVRQDGRAGRGKACRNTRRLAMIVAGNFVGGSFSRSRIRIISSRRRSHISSCPSRP